MLPSDRTTRTTEPARLGVPFLEEENRAGFQNAMWYSNLSKQHHSIHPTQLFILRKIPHFCIKYQKISSGWVKTQHFITVCHLVDDMFRPFTIRPSSGLKRWKN